MAAKLSSCSSVLCELLQRIVCIALWLRYAVVRCLSLASVCVESTELIIKLVGWLGGSVVERRSLTGELSLVCTGPAAVGNHLNG